MKAAFLSELRKKKNFQSKDKVINVIEAILRLKGLLQTSRLLKLKDDICAINFTSQVKLCMMQCVLTFLEGGCIVELQ